MAPRGRATQQTPDFYLCLSIYCDLGAVQYQLLLNFNNVGPQRVFWDRGRMAIYFQGAVEHW